MNLVFAREYERLKESILRLAGEVESRLTSTLRAIAERDTGTLLALEDLDAEIDEREVLIEEECLKILALHQPVAKDLRFVVAVLKINNDIERVGDIVVNLADRGTRLAAFPVPPLQERLMEMGRLARGMLKQSIDALVALDRHAALEVIRQDDTVDDLNAAIIRDVIAEMARGANAPEPLLLTYGMARDIERIGDHAANIAEDVVYLVDGSIIRHRSGTLTAND
ncbi:MAG: phosphate signaling complex protein PhoU [Kiritimatiellaeota bacterium]|nr:phosphate signaling complex protein PhoU [Kiritimatiellota bacterium]